MLSRKKLVGPCVIVQLFALSTWRLVNWGSWFGLVDWLIEGGSRWWETRPRSLINARHSDHMCQGTHTVSQHCALFRSNHLVSDISREVRWAKDDLAKSCNRTRQNRGSHLLVEALWWVSIETLLFSLQFYWTLSLPTCPFPFLSPLPHHHCCGELLESFLLRSSPSRRENALK